MRERGLQTSGRGAPRYGDLVRAKGYPSSSRFGETLEAMAKPRRTGFHKNPNLRGGPRPRGAPSVPLFFVSFSCKTARSKEPYGVDEG